MRFLLLTLALFLASECEANAGVLEIELRLGPTMERAALSEFDLTIRDARGKLWNDRITGNRARLPYGQYRVSVHSPGFEWVDRDVWIREGKQSMLIILPLGGIADCAPRGCLEWAFGGTIAGHIAKKEQLWVRLDPIGSGRGPFEAKPGKNGRFRFTGYGRDDYILSVFAIPAKRVARVAGSRDFQPVRLLHSQVIAPSGWSDRYDDVLIELDE